MIKRIEIVGLFGERDIFVNLEKKTNILVGENGTGKSHVLNIIYYLMANKLLELLKIDFKLIKIFSSNDIEYELRKEELEQVYYNKSLERGPLGFIRNNISKSEFEYLIIALQEKREIRKLDFIKDLTKRSPRIRMAIRELQENNELSLFDLIASDNINKVKKFLSKSYEKYENESILYLPTYRRIEKGLQQLVHNSDLIEEFEVEDSNSLINFGMNDTKDLINSLLNEISDSFLMAYAELSENMLNELLIALDSKFEPIQIENLDLELVELVLERVTGRIAEKDRARVLSIVKQNKTTKQNYPILSMIKNLIDLYEGSTKKLEDRIEKFVEVCNRYLVNKDFIYNKKNVTLVIENKFNKNKNITIDQLSSGEKQIVSLFAKIYLKEVDNFIIFFDEPELSLSIEWQRMLLNDILNTKSCEFLFVTTHSPFIFEPLNLLKATVDIDDCTKVYQETGVIDE
ncbi:hypothetical protein CRU99_08945 [Malaciobacter mytili]|uniref:AAA family ATPase n=1 Tax=Malaciobacter mytili TaxID=603050 RepID=UPI00100B308A|nr:AAA family ATPase [Malaciobacter mytili]RXI42638.1 hypothetical protein CRU99_08945 [Malaciobacter mytili]